MCKSKINNAKAVYPKSAGKSLNVRPSGPNLSAISPYNDNPTKAVLIVIALVGLSLYGLMALRLGPEGRTFNDFPALFGYTALALLIFDLHINWVNQLILFTSKISYPLF